MSSLVILLALLAGDDPVSLHLSWDQASLPNDSAVPATDGQPPADGASGSSPFPGASSDLRSAIRAYRNSGGVRYYVRGKSDWQHLIQDHGWKAEQIRGLGLDELQFLHGATHTRRIQPNQYVAASCYAAPFNPETVSLLPSPGADTKPAITITVAPFHCPPCNQLKGMDWSDFSVTWRTGGNVRAYPEISWTDKRGTKRTLTGAYSPWRVRWSWERTQ